MKAKKTLSVLLSAVLVSAGANMSVSNAAVTAPDIKSSTAYDNNVEASRDKYEELFMELQYKLDILREELEYQRYTIYEKESGYERLYISSDSGKKAIDDISNITNELHYMIDDDIVIFEETEANYKKQISALNNDRASLKSDLSQAQSQNKSLSSEIASLKAELSLLSNNGVSYKDNIMRLDANDDGALNAVDASILLSIYAYNSTNNSKITTLSEYFKKFRK